MKRALIMILVLVLLLLMLVPVAASAHRGASHEDCGRTLGQTHAALARAGAIPGAHLPGSHNGAAGFCGLGVGA